MLQCATIALFVFHLRPFVMDLIESSVSRRGLLAGLEAFCLMIVLPMEHVYAQRPSTIFSFYLAATTTLQAILQWSSMAQIVLHENLLHKEYAIATRAIVLVLHEQSKWHNLSPAVRATLGQEEAGSIWSRVFSMPMYRILQTGPSPDLLSDQNGYVSPQLLTQQTMPSFNRAWRSCTFAQYIPILFKTNLLRSIIALWASSILPRHL